DRAGRLTPLGEQVRRVPLHPRLARMLAAAGGARQMAQACALLSERHLLPPRTASTTSDLLSALDRWSEMPSHVHRAADTVSAIFRQSATRDRESAMTSEADFRRAVLAGYPDRVAQRRAAGAAEVLLASGTGATLSRDSGVRDGEFLIALDVVSTTSNQSAIRNPQSSMPLVRL